MGPTSYIFARNEVPDSQDPPCRSVRSVVILVANMYVHTGGCRSAHVACTRTCSGQCARKKIRPRMCTYGRGLKRLLAHIYVRPGLVYMAGSKLRNNVVVVFMGSQPAGSERNASSCLSGGLGRNSRWKRGLAYRRTEETALCSIGHIQNGILFIGRGLAYRKMEETDLLRW